MVRDYLPNSVTGICYNHHSKNEPAWREAAWGSNLARLEEIKEEVDPDHRFNCWHCVGYTGPSVESPSGHQEYANSIVFTSTNGTCGDEDDFPLVEECDTSVWPHSLLSVPLGHCVHNAGYSVLCGTAEHEVYTVVVRQGDSLRVSSYSGCTRDGDPVGDPLPGSQSMLPVGPASCFTSDTFVATMVESVTAQPIYPVYEPGQLPPLLQPEPEVELELCGAGENCGFVNCDFFVPASFDCGEYGDPASLPAVESCDQSVYPHGRLSYPIGVCVTNAVYGVACGLSDGPGAVVINVRGNDVYAQSYESCDGQGRGVGATGMTVIPGASGSPKCSGDPNAPWFKLADFSVTNEPRYQVYRFDDLPEPEVPKPAADCSKDAHCRRSSCDTATGRCGRCTGGRYLTREGRCVEECPVGDVSIGETASGRVCKPGPEFLCFSGDDSCTCPESLGLCLDCRVDATGGAACLRCDPSKYLFEKGGVMRCNGEITCAGTAFEEKPEESCHCRTNDVPGNDCFRCKIRGGGKDKTAQKSCLRCRNSQYLSGSRCVGPAACPEGQVPAYSGAYGRKCLAPLVCRKNRVTDSSDKELLGKRCKCNSHCMQCSWSEQGGWRPCFPVQGLRDPVGCANPEIRLVPVVWAALSREPPSLAVGELASSRGLRVRGFTCLLKQPLRGVALAMARRACCTAVPQT